MKNIKILGLFVTISIMMLSCSSESSFNDATSSESGKGGSMARFAVVDNYLYTVNNESMKLFNISDDAQPYFSNDVHIGFGIETIFPKDTMLYIGSQDGMFIYSIETPNNPIRISDYWHMTSCDPVIVDGNFAYVTLHTNDNNEGMWCGNNTNELHIIDISDITYPNLLQAYPMTRPLGLGIDENKLFLCDDGLKVYDISNSPEITLLQTFDISANDVIALGEILLVVGNDGLYQYSYSNDNLEFLSKLEVCNNNILP